MKRKNKRERGWRERNGDGMIKGKTGKKEVRWKEKDKMERRRYGEMEEKKTGLRRE